MKDSGQAGLGLIILALAVPDVIEALRAKRRGDDDVSYACFGWLVLGAGLIIGAMI